MSEQGRLRDQKRVVAAWVASGRAYTVPYAHSPARLHYVLADAALWPTPASSPCLPRLPSPSSSAASPGRAHVRPVPYPDAEAQARAPGDFCVWAPAPQQLGMMMKGGTPPGSPRQPPTGIGVATPNLAYVIASLGDDV